MLKLNQVVVVVSELCPVELSQEVQADIQKLRDCISVLFMFVRQPIQDKEFVTILNGWMEQLVCFASLMTYFYGIVYSSQWSTLRRSFPVNYLVCF